MKNLGKIHLYTGLFFAPLLLYLALSGAWFILSEVMKNPNVRLYDGSMHQWTLEKRPTVRMRMD